MRLDALDSAQSLALIESRGGAPLDPGGRSSALEVAEAGGRLPLALELVYARPGQLDVSWPVLRDGVLGKTARSVSPRAGFPAGSADRSTGSRAVARWVAERLPADLREAFAWLGLLPAGATNSRLCRAVVRTDARAVSSRLRRLAGFGLIAGGISREGDTQLPLPRRDPGRGVGAGDRLQRARVAEGLARLGPVPLRIRLGAARSACGRRTSSNPLGRRDAPERRPPSWPPEQAARPEDVDALLAEQTPEGENAWFLAYELRSDRFGYLGDVDRAWERADESAKSGGGPGPVAAQCRYALIRGSVNPRVEEPPQELPALMVANGLWTPRSARRLPSVGSGTTGPGCPDGRWPPTSTAQHATT